MKRLFKRIFLIGIFLCFLEPFIVHATDTSVEVKTIGETSKGNIIDIQINLNNVINMYAASIDFNYDNTLLSIKEINTNSTITGKEMYEYKYPDYEGNKVRYGFTAFGGVSGYTGSGNFLSIKAEIISEGKLDINSENFKIDLVKKENGSMVDMKYQLVIAEQISVNKDTVTSDNSEPRETEGASVNNTKSEEANIDDNSSISTKPKIETNNIDMNTQEKVTQEENLPIKEVIDTNNISSKDNTENSNNTIIETESNVGNITDFKDNEVMYSTIESSTNDATSSGNERSSNKFFLPILAAFIVVISLYGCVVYNKKRTRRI